MNNQLVVDFEDLRSIASKMTQTSKELEAINDNHDFSINVFQIPNVCNILNDVNNKWKYNRKKLGQEINDLANDCQKIISEFEANDQKLYFQERTLTAGELLG